VKRVILCLTLTLIFGIGIGMRMPQAAAQDGTYNLPILAINCPSLPGSDEYPFENWQHPCEPSSGVSFMVTDAATGDALGSCVTVISPAPEPQASAYCNVPVDFGAQVIVTIDPSTVPAGYLPVEDSDTVTAPDSADAGQTVVAEFINVLQAETSGDGSTTQLPSTGSGTTALIRSVSTWWD
jgi:hypothetical protein